VAQDPQDGLARVIDIRLELEDMAKQRDAAAVARDEAAEARDVAGVVDSQQVITDRVLAAGDRAAAVLDRREEATMRNAALARDEAAEARDLLTADASESREQAGERVAAALDRHATALRAATESAMEIAVEVRLGTWTGVGDQQRVAGDRLLAAEDRVAAALDRQGAALMRAASLARDIAAEARDTASADAGAQQGAGERGLAAEDRAAAAQDRQDAAFDRHEAAGDLQNAYRDDLTGTLLRDPGCEQLAAATDRAQRTGDPLVFAFLDVDGLKEINDRDGHGAGDALLQAVGTALRVGLRSYDVVVRYGGDEFVCALPGSRLADAATRFGRVQRLLVTAMSGASVSIGLAELQPDETATEAIARADGDMYRARRASRGEPPS
jgi:diguanylate cyclase (GGDEF)-like protein